MATVVFPCLERPSAFRPRAFFFPAALILLAGCAGLDRPIAAAPQPAAVFCSAFEPIRWSRLDTEETVRQAQEHNAAGVSLCGWKAGR